MPKKIVTRTKTGFSVPLREWISEMTGSRGRGLRDWAKVIFRNHSTAKRALVLVTDAYGGFGGIAKFNRDFLASCAAHDQYREIVALPIIISETITEALPRKLRYERTAANGKASYAWALLSALIANRRFDVVVCGHLNLLPLAWLASRVSAAPLVLIIHGTEAWRPSPRRLSNRLIGKIDYLISVSKTTRQRLQTWAQVNEKTSFILPNCVDMGRFQPRDKRVDLLDKYQCNDKTVFMTLGRLDSREAYKGIDEVLEVLPRLVQSIPELLYLIVGHGTDVPRLRQKADALGISSQVGFAGSISEKDKVDYYNLADAFVMPGRGEGFGIVYLEAMACGVPVVASVLDGSKEAVRDGMLGILVDPDNLASVESGIREALAGKRGIPAGLDYFSDTRFRARVHMILDEVSSRTV